MAFNVFVKSKDDIGKFEMVVVSKAGDLGYKKCFRILIDENDGIVDIHQAITKNPEIRFGLKEMEKLG